MKQKTGKIFFGLAVLAASVMTAVPASLAWDKAGQAKWESANQSYRDGRYEEALAGYQELAKDHPRAASVYYNLGNTFFRMKKMGQSILYYEMALDRAPRNADIRVNLDYARSLSQYKMDDKRNWYLKAIESLVHYWTEDEVWAVFLASLFLFLVAWVWVSWFRRGLPWGWLRKFLLVMTLLFGALCAAKYAQTHVIRDAIILLDQAEVRYGPSLGDQVAFRLGEGLKVYVLERRADWSRILLLNGESGWVQNVHIGEVRVP